MESLEATYYTKNKAIRATLLKRPSWLKRGKKLDEIWKTFKHLNNALLLLITNEYISKRSIESIIFLFKVNKESLCDDEDTELLFTIYYVDTVEFLEDVCLEYELYEALSNLKVFRKQLAKL